MALLERHSIAEAKHSCSSSCASSAVRHTHCACARAPSAATPPRAASCARSSPCTSPTSKERARVSCCRRASITRSDESCSLIAEAVSVAPASSTHRTSARSVCASTEAHTNCACRRWTAALSMALSSRSTALSAIRVWRDTMPSTSQVASSAAMAAIQAAVCDASSPYCCCS